MTYQERWGHPRKRQNKGWHKQEKERKRIEALERQARYDALTSQEKIELAQSRRGKSEKEIKRLMAEAAQ